MALTVVAAALLSGAGLAVADDASDPGATDGYTSPLPPDASPEDQAMDRATATGQPVVVDTLTTPYSQTTANPDGTLTQESTAAPTRVRQGNA